MQFPAFPEFRRPPQRRSHDHRRQHLRPQIQRQRRGSHSGNLEPHHRHWRTVANMAMPAPTTQSPCYYPMAPSGPPAAASPVVPPTTTTPRSSPRRRSSHSDGSLAARPIITRRPHRDRPRQPSSPSGPLRASRKFALIRMSSQTHSASTDLRYLTLPFTETSPGDYTLTGHALMPKRQARPLLDALRAEPSRYPLGGENHPGDPEHGRRSAKPGQPGIHHGRHHPAPDFVLRAAWDHPELHRHKPARGTVDQFQHRTHFRRDHRDARQLHHHRQRDPQRGRPRDGFLQLEGECSQHPGNRRNPP